MLKVQRFFALGFAIVTLTSGVVLIAQTGTPNDLVLNKLKEQFPVTVFDRDASQVLTPGAVVTLRKDGFLVFRLPVPAHPISTYKNGKLSQGFGDTFATCLLNGVGQPNGCNDIPQKTLMTGEKFWISAIVVGKKDIQFVAVTDPYDDGRYIGQIKFPFGNGTVLTPDEALRMVSEVVTTEAGQNQAAQDLGDQPVALPGTYELKAIGSRLLLLPDGSFTKSVAGGQGQGSYVVDGDDLALTFTSTGFAQHFKIQGGNILDVNTNQVWARTGNAPGAAQDGGLPTVSGKYNLENGSAQIIFVSGTSCTIQVPDAPPFSGRYVVLGDTVTIGCTVSGAGLDFKIQGDKIVAGNGQVWVRAGGAMGSAQVPLPEIAPPPPPADAPPPTIALGQTKDKVTAAFGQPVRIAKLGVKEIFYYKDMKVTFANGKVSNVE